MGAKASSLEILSSNELLRKYIGQEKILPLDSFWNEFLKSDWLSQIDYNTLEKVEELEPSILRQFKRHNVKTHNLSALMHFIITRGSELVSTSSTNETYKNLISVVQNAVLVFRISAKYLLEHTSEQNFMKHLSDTSGDASTTPCLLENFLYTVFLLLTKIPVNGESYALHCEIETAVLVLFAGQMHRQLSSPLPLTLAYAIWGKCAQLAPALVHRLLTNFSENVPTPPGLLGKPGQSSFMWRAASSLAGGLLTVVTLGYANRASSQSASQTNKQNGSDSSQSTSTPASDLVTSEPIVRSALGCNMLAEQSALLLLVLTTQAGSIAKSANLPQVLGLPSETPTLNPYRVALFSLRDAKQDQASIPPVNGSMSEAAEKVVPKSQPGGAMLRGVVSTNNPEMDAFPVDFAAFRDMAAQTLHQDSSTLLLYLLVHRNTHFQAFLLQDKNYEKLLLPLLNILYRSPVDSSHLVYMGLIIILILTENDKFGREIHSSLIDWVNWSPSRRLTSISRGSLVILVLIRTIRYHLNQLKDKYLHVNILAALANLSAKVKNLHPHVSDSFLCLLQLLTKRYNRTVEQLQHLSSKSIDSLDKSTNKTVDETQSGHNPAVSTNGTANTEEAMVQELSLLEEVIRMILEILNSVLTHVLPENVNLVYSLLYQRDCLTSLRSHPSFQNVIQNLDTILTYFSTKIEQEVGDNPSSPEQLLTVINKHAANVYRNCNLKKFPDLQFKYVEEESPDDFFIPYVWSVVLRQSGIAFQTDRLRLFNSEADGVNHELDPDRDPAGDDVDDESPSSTKPTATGVAV